MNEYLHEVVVDEVDDLQMSGQNLLKHVSWPAFQSLWKDGVIGVGAATGSDVPGLERTGRLKPLIPKIGVHLLIKTNCRILFWNVFYSRY